MEIYNKEFYSGFAEVDLVVKEAVEALRKVDIKSFDKVEFRINFMLREILNNAVEHGNRFDRTKKVVLTITYEQNVLLFVVEDEGEGIDVRRHGRGYEVIKNFDFDVCLEGTIVEVTLNMKKIF